MKKYYIATCCPICGGKIKTPINRYHDNLWQDCPVCGCAFRVTKEMIEEEDEEIQRCSDDGCPIFFGDPSDEPDGGAEE